MKYKLGQKLILKVGLKTGNVIVYKVIDVTLSDPIPYVLELTIDFPASFKNFNRVAYTEEEIDKQFLKYDEFTEILYS